MEILKHGNTAREFKCSECGCVWIASKKEYLEAMDYEHNLYEYICKCPECDNRVTNCEDIYSEQEEEKYCYDEDGNILYF